MPDITMGEGTRCPLKESCYRYNAIPSPYRQSYFADIPWNEETKRCGSYWEEPYKVDNRMRSIITKMKNTDFKT